MGTITLPNFRVSADVKMNTRLKDGGVYIDWNSLTEIKVWLFSNDQKAKAGRCDVSIDETDGTKLVCRYSASKPQYLGVNKIIVQATYQGATKTYDKPVFNFVRWTADQAGEEITMDDPEVDVEIVAEDISSSVLDEATAAALAAADRAEAAAEAAEHMVDIKTGPAGKSPYIGENGHWFEWDETAKEYKDTGQVAQGPKGDTPTWDDFTPEEQEEILDGAAESLAENKLNGDDLAQSADGKIQLADRTYNAQQPNGMGYKILRKNATFASQVTDINTIYEIRYSFDLGGEEFAMPSGCVLRFVGGSISNGTITTNPFRVVADNDVSILKGISFDGSYITNETIFVDWFDFAADGVTDDRASFKRLQGLVNNKGGGHIVFGVGKTYCELPILIHITNINPNENQYGLWFDECPDTLDIDLNGSTLKMLGSNTALAGIVAFFNCANARIHNGHLRGDRDVHDYSAYIRYDDTSSTNFQLVHNLIQMGGELDVEGIVSDYACGDGFIVGSHSNWNPTVKYPGTYTIKNCEVSYCGRNGITLHSAYGVPTVTDTYIHHIGETETLPGWSPKAGIDIEFEDSAGELGDMRFTNLRITDCVNRTISSFTNTQVRTFVANNIYSVGLYQISNIKGDLVETVGSYIEETKNGSYLIGGSTFRDCKIKFTTIGHLLDGVTLVGCVVTSEFEEEPTNPVLIDSSGATLIGCDVSLHRSILRYFEFVGCKVTLKQTASYPMVGITASDSTFEGVLDESGYSASLTHGNLGSVVRRYSGIFKNCTFKNMTGYNASNAGINSNDSNMDGTTFDGCFFENSSVEKSNTQYNFVGCRFDNLKFKNTTILKSRKFVGCSGSVYFSVCNATYKEEIESCNLVLLDGTYPSFSASFHAIVKNSVLTDNGSTIWSGSAADLVAKNSVLVFNKNYTSSSMVLEGCNITGITEAQFTGTKQNCIFAVPFATSGATADRPTASAVGAGFTYFDTDLGKMIVSNGTDWVNMDGTALS